MNLVKFDVMQATLRKAGCAATAMLAVLLLCSAAFPQANQGTIQGSVFDQTGGALVGAKVTVIDVDRGVTRNLLSDSAGAYVAPNLNPGNVHGSGGSKWVSDVGAVQHSRGSRPDRSH